MVYSIGHSNTTKFAQIMILGWPLTPYMKLDLRWAIHDHWSSGLEIILEDDKVSIVSQQICENEIVKLYKGNFVKKKKKKMSFWKPKFLDSDTVNWMSAKIGYREIRNFIQALKIFYYKDWYHFNQFSCHKIFNTQYHQRQMWFYLR